MSYVPVRKSKHTLGGTATPENDALRVRYPFAATTDIALIGITMPCFLRLPKDRLQHNSVDDCSVLNCVISSGNEFWFSMEKSVCDVTLFDDRTPNCTLNIPFV